jgi:hypothetical protein
MSYPEKTYTGNYSSVKFDVGLNSADDSINAITQSDTSIFSAKAGSWFGSLAKGYMFVNFQGKLMYTQTASVYQPFSLQLGGVSNRVTVVMPTKNISFLPNQTNFIHITMDYLRLLDGLTSQTGYVSDSVSINPVVSAKAVQNIPAMFAYEE